MTALLEDKVAVVYGGGGAIGGAAAREFAREGARVFIAGRTLSKLEAVARDITAAGGRAQVAVLDINDERAVNAHADAVEKSGAREVFEGFAKRLGIPVHEMLAEHGRTATLLGRCRSSRRWRSASPSPPPIGRVR